MMKRSTRFGFLTGIVMLCCLSAANSQVLVESVAAIVGNEVVYLSDIENLVNDLRRSGRKQPLEDLRCSALQELMIAKLFLDQARIDSITVTDDMVEADLNMKLNDAIRQAGSEKALETYFKKSMVEIRRDIRKSLT